MERSIQMPLDRDGYLRRACPSCQREFKWLPQDNGLPVPPEGYHCPYCGRVANQDDWWTRPQLAYARAHAVNLVTDEVNNALRGFTQQAAPLQVTVTTAPKQPIPTLTESDDMTIVTKECHPSEPVKVNTQWEGPLRCLYCGRA